MAALTVFATLLVACGTADDEKPPAEKQYELSIGIAVTPTLTSNRVSETVAAIVTDKSERIVLCRFDCIEFEAKYADGVLDTTAPVSKGAQEETDDSSAPLPAESWSFQAAALAKHLTGKNRAEIAAIKLDDGKPADKELASQCSIDVTDLLGAVDNAFKSERGIVFGTTSDKLTAGIAIRGAIKDAETESAENATFTADFACSVLADGKVVSSILDSTELELKNVTDGGAEAYVYADTKRQQGEAYDPNNVLEAGTWYIQADAYAKSAIGKTAADISTLATEGVAGCTIYAAGYKQVLEQAVKTAK